MYIDAAKHGDCWLVRNAWGHDLKLPCRETYKGASLEIGTLGTRAPGFKPKPYLRRFEAVAQMLDTLHRPLYLMDTRRGGTGASSSWSPLEFATKIPALLSPECSYAFLHLPCLAPSIELRNDENLSWEGFRDRYRQELSQEALNVAQAFVESAAERGGLPILLCAEEYCMEFEKLSQQEQEASYCHRFTLARCLADRLKATYTEVNVTRVDLDIRDFVASRPSYQPRRKTL